jgi:uncharacterized ion transporter superfamily protein YfcC
MSNKVIKSVSIFLLIFFLFNFSENENKSTLNDLLKNKKQSKVNNKEELTNDDKENEDTKDKGFDAETNIKLLLFGAAFASLVYFIYPQYAKDPDENWRKLGSGIALILPYVSAYGLTSLNDEEEIKGWGKWLAIGGMSVTVFLCFCPSIY